MSLITDIELIRIEPSIFIDAPNAATTLLSAADGAVSGTTLTSAGSDFAAAGIDAGHVAVVGNEAIEIDERLSATTLAVSRPRTSSTEEKIDPTQGTGLAITVRTFARLIEEEQLMILAALGENPTDPDAPIEESQILNVADIGRLIALRTIAQAFAVAAAADPSDLSLAQRWNVYRSRARQAMHHTAVRLDFDGDGIADATRRVDIVIFTRL